MNVYTVSRSFLAEFPGDAAITEIRKCLALEPGYNPDTKIIIEAQQVFISQYMTIKSCLSRCPFLELPKMIYGFYTVEKAKDIDTAKLEQRFIDFVKTQVTGDIVVMPTGSGVCNFVKRRIGYKVDGVPACTVSTLAEYTIINMEETSAEIKFKGYGFVFDWFKTVFAGIEQQQIQRQKTEANVTAIVDLLNQLATDANTRTGENPKGYDSVLEWIKTSFVATESGGRTKLPTPGQPIP